MAQVTVSKLQIAQAKECVERADKYLEMLHIIIELCKVTSPLATNKKFPDDFQVAQKRSWEVIIHDLESMKSETVDMALYKAEKAQDLAKTREKQLEALVK